MILTKADLKQVLKLERDIYLPKKYFWERMLELENSYKIYQYVKLLRKTEYHYNKKSSVIHLLMYAYTRRKKNILGRKLGIEMWENTFDSGLRIEHSGNIVVNGHSRVGKNCILHGSNCIGNNGKTPESPILGDNVRIGVGAKIIGGVEIASNVTIAAGAVVIESCTIEGAILAGVPAKVVKVNLVND
ncbi:MAG: poly-gamma-glutamate biosynthesis protein [Clostridia bacterium]|nr:poly-gamma-glutamate biosynthesis protein [Clostridia bacterium]